MNKKNKNKDENSIVDDKKFIMGFEDYAHFVDETVRSALKTSCPILILPMITATILDKKHTGIEKYLNMLQIFVDSSEYLDDGKYHNEVVSYSFLLEWIINLLSDDLWKRLDPDGYSQLSVRRSIKIGNDDSAGDEDSSSDIEFHEDVLSSDTKNQRFTQTPLEEIETKLFPYDTTGALALKSPYGRCLAGLIAPYSDKIIQQSGFSDDCIGAKAHRLANHRKGFSDTVRSYLLSMCSFPTAPETMSYSIDSRILTYPQQWHGADDVIRLATERRFCIMESGLIRDEDSFVSTLCSNGFKLIQKVDSLNEIKGKNGVRFTKEWNHIRRILVQTRIILYLLNKEGDTEDFGSQCTELLDRE